MRWFLFAAAILICGLIFLAVREPALPVMSAQVTRGPTQESAAERGKTRLPTVHRVTMPLSGRIRPISLQEGDPVSAGQVVAELDPADLETDLSESEAQVSQYEEALNSMARTIEAAEERIAASLARFQFWDREYKRTLSLSETKAVSQSELNAAELRKLETRAEHQQDVLQLRAIESMRAALGIARTDASEKQKRRQRDRKRAELKSDISGVVLKRAEWDERVLPAGHVVLEIGDLGQLEIEAEVLTQDAARIPPNADVELRSPAIGDLVLKGTVSRIDPQAFTKVSSLGVEQQRVLVIIRFDRAQMEQLRKTSTLGVGFRFECRIIKAQKSDTLKVPRSAMFRGKDGAWECFVVENQRARLTRVTIGLANDREMEVLSGLKEGDAVVLAPESALQEGSRVKPAE